MSSRKRPSPAPGDSSGSGERALLVGIHPLWLESDPNGGIATYWNALFEHLCTVGGSSRFRVYFNDEIALKRTPLAECLEPRLLWPRTRWIELPFSLPLDLYRHPVDLLHAQMLAPFHCPAPFVLTINDVAWETNPEVFPVSIRLRLKKLVPRSARRAQRILTVSNFTKDCLIKFYDLPEERIVVTYHGVSGVYHPVRDPELLVGLRVKYNLPQRFILYVGKLQARKNLPRLLQAFSSLVRNTDMPHHLVLVGARTWMSEEIFSTIATLGLGDRVLVTGEVPLHDLVLFYNAAEIFAFPSLAEGFGLPPLEAFACGTPVASSNASSLPEVVGDAGLMFDPYDVEAIARALHELADSEELRRTLSERGLKRARRFSNATMTRETHDVYRQAVRDARDQRLRKGTA
jgi:glycosyltransferase involved in cell wall biosynthesis